MALPDVQDILAGWPGWATLELDNGNQQSGQGSGQTIVKDLRPTIWRLHAETTVISPNQIRYWVARLAGLDDGRGMFLGRDFTATYPIAYPNGSYPLTGGFNGVNAKVHSVGGDGKSLRLKSLGAGYAGKIGDHVQVTYGAGNDLALFMVMEDFTADGSGVSGAFEVRPQIPAAVAADNVVAVKQPACVMQLVPGSVQRPRDVNVRGVVSFDAVQVMTK